MDIYLLFILASRKMGQRTIWLLRGGGGFVLPETSGDRKFFADIQSHCVAGISLQEFFLVEIQSAEYCFLKHLSPPPFKSQMAGP